MRRAFRESVPEYRFDLVTPQTPEQLAREHIDAALVAAGWVVQNRAEMNLAAGPGVAGARLDRHGYQRSTLPGARGSRSSSLDDTR